MKPKTYTPKLIQDVAQPLYYIHYQVSKTVDKEIQFSCLEHYLQFVGLLQEAGYKEIENAQDT
jgi:hypothetical protein